MSIFFTLILHGMQSFAATILIRVLLILSICLKDDMISYRPLTPITRQDNYDRYLYIRNLRHDAHAWSLAIVRTLTL